MEMRWIFLIVFIYSCTPFKTEGDIVEKWYEPERTYTIYQTINGISFPHTYYDDEDFCIKVEMVYVKNDKFRKKTSTYYLTKETWDEYKIGDFFMITGKHNKEEDEYVE